jgi:hypothetical protein
MLTQPMLFHSSTDWPLKGGKGVPDFDREVKYQNATAMKSTSPNVPPTILPTIIFTWDSLSKKTLLLSLVVTESAVGVEVVAGAGEELLLDVGVGIAIDSVLSSVQQAV